MRRQPEEPQAVEALEPRTLMDSSLAALPREILETNSDIQSVVTADFNGDGRVDLAVSAGRELFVLLRNPRVGYAKPIVTRLSQSVGSLEVANLDGDGVPDLVAFGGRAAGGQKAVLRALIGRGDGRFTLSDRAFVAVPPSDGTFIAVGDVFVGSPLDLPAVRRDEVVIGSSQAGDGGDLRMYRFEDGRFDGGSVVAAGAIGGSFVRPVFFDVDGDRDLDIITARNGPTGGTVVAVLMGVIIGPGPAEVLLAHRAGRIDSVLAGDLGEGNGGARVIFASTEPDNDSGFFVQPGDSVIETLSLSGGDATEIYRIVNDNYVYGEPVDRTIELLDLTDSNSDGRIDIIAQERLNGPRPSPLAVLPLAVHRESALLQLIAPSDRLGFYQAVRTHQVGGRSTSSAAPLSRGYDARYAVGNVAGTAAADLVMFRDNKLLLGLGDLGQEAPVISRIEPSEILPAVVGAYGFSAAGVYDTDAVRGGYIAAVRVYLDLNDNGRWDVSDPVIGNDTDGSDGWRFGGIASPDWPAAGRVFIVAQDERGLISELVQWAVSVPRDLLL